ncbi:hypothetical protein [Rhizobium sp. SYY.PMSO]|uniref:hypothetical protein n=1 Tax=Rhizobium sp. SYY.PMSO TaxID=3382192 RepID=UPI00398FAF85
MNLAESVTFAVVNGENIIAAICTASRYSLEQLSVVSGLTTSEILALQDGVADPEKLQRLLTSLSLPSDIAKA